MRAKPCSRANGRKEFPQHTQLGFAIWNLLSDAD